MIKRGKILRRNLRQELLTVDDVWEQLRKKGIEDIATVRAAYMEGDGEFSVLLVGGSKPDSGGDKGPAGLT